MGRAGGGQEGSTQAGEAEGSQSGPESPQQGVGAGARRLSSIGECGIDSVSYCGCRGGETGGKLLFVSR